jgi:hypothetical protein
MPFLYLISANILIICRLTATLAFIASYGRVEKDWMLGTFIPILNLD